MNRLFAFFIGSFLSLLIGIVVVTAVASPHSTTDITNRPPNNGIFYGNGSWGDFICVNPCSMNGVREPLLATALAGDTVLMMNTAGDYIEPGYELLIIQMQGDNAGIYEFGIIQSDNGNSVTLTAPLQRNYTVGGNSKVQLIPVPNYANVTIPTGTILSAFAWDGTTGGILIFRANGMVNIEAGGTIEATGKGFRGSSLVNVSQGQRTGQGEGYVGPGDTLSASANGNGGGGGRRESGQDVLDYGGGGGGGNATSGGNAERQGAQGGGTIGSPDFTTFSLGGGGGAGGGTHDGPQSGGSGGNGGGAILIFASSLTINGSIHSNGTDGTCRSAGGGAGGSILIRIGVANISNNPTAVGGVGNWCNTQEGYGGNGGNGYISLQFQNTAPVATNIRFVPPIPEPGQPFTVEYDYSDANQDPRQPPLIRWSRVWQEQSQLQPILNDQENILGGVSVDGESWCATITPYDGQDYGEPATGCTHIGQTPPNGLPKALHVLLTPLTPSSPVSLAVSYTYSDTESQPQNLPLTEIRWYRDKILQPAYNNLLSLPSIEAKPGEMWCAAVRVHDGLEYGPFAESNCVMVQPDGNGLPQASNAQITTDTLALVLSYDYFDPDGDLESGSRIRWYRNDVLQPGLNGLTAVPPTVLIPGDVWQAIIEPNDGHGVVGLAAKTNAFAIPSPANIAPAIDNIAITPAHHSHDHHEG